MNVAIDGPAVWLAGCPDRDGQAEEVVRGVLDVHGQTPPCAGWSVTLPFLARRRQTPPLALVVHALSRP